MDAERLEIVLPGGDEGHFTFAEHAEFLAVGGVDGVGGRAVDGHRLDLGDMHRAQGEERT